MITGKQPDIIGDQFNDPATNRTAKPGSTLPYNCRLNPSTRTNKKTHTQPETKKLLMALNNADLLGLIDYLKDTPEYDQPTDTGSWLNRIINELTKTTNNNQERENN
jgi:hypothetical protein